MSDQMSAHRAKKIVNEAFRAKGSTLEAVRTKRVNGGFLVDYIDPAYPHDLLCGGGCAVSDDGEIHYPGSTPAAVDALLAEWEEARQMREWGDE